MPFCYHQAMKKSSKGRQARSRKGKAKSQLSDFSTLNQVTGVPKPRQHHSSIPVDNPREISEPCPECPVCGKVIDCIASAFSTPEGYIHFDCALERVAKDERLLDGQKISYLGSGCFGVVEKTEEGGYAILKRIPFENPDSTKSMKEYVEGLKR